MDHGSENIKTYVLWRTKKKFPEVDSYHFSNGNYFWRNKLEVYYIWKEKHFGFSYETEVHHKWNLAHALEDIRFSDENWLQKVVEAENKVIKELSSNDFIWTFYIDFTMERTWKLQFDYDYYDGPINSITFGPLRFNHRWWTKHNI